MTIDSTAALLAALLFVLLLLCQLKRMFCIDYGIGKSIESNILRESRTLKNKNEPNKCCSISSWLLYCYFIFDWKYENLCNLLIVISRNIPEIFGFTLFFFSKEIRFVAFNGFPHFPFHFLFVASTKSRSSCSMHVSICVLSIVSIHPLPLSRSSDLSFTAMCALYMLMKRFVSKRFTW